MRDPLTTTCKSWVRAHVRRFFYSPTMASATPACAPPPPQPGPLRTPKKLARVAVFCGSSPGKSPAYREAAVALGQEIAARGMGLVYGGT